MAKFNDYIGYTKTIKKDGVVKNVITERLHRGDLQKNVRRWSNNENVNDDLTVSNIFSIVGDPFAYENFFAIKWVKWMGVKWKVLSVDASTRPRLIISVGGVYNENETTTTSTP